MAQQPLKQRSPAPATSVEDMKLRLLADHESLELGLVRLGQAMENNDSPADLCLAWAEFEASLRDHLATEERYLFPLFAAAQRESIAGLSRDHQQIRNALNELGVAAELHTLRKPAVDDLICFLREHRLREDSSLYDWMQRRDDTTARRGLLAMFERRRARAVHGR